MEDKWRGGAVGGATGAVSSVSTRWRPEQWSGGDTLTTGRTRHCTLHWHTALTALCTYRYRGSWKVCYCSPCLHDPHQWSSYHGACCSLHSLLQYFYIHCYRCTAVHCNNKARGQSCDSLSSSLHLQPWLQEMSWLWLVCAGWQLGGVLTGWQLQRRIMCEHTASIYRYPTHHTHYTPPSSV